MERPPRIAVYEWVWCGHVRNKGREKKEKGRGREWKGTGEGKGKERERERKEKGKGKGRGKGEERNARGRMWEMVGRVEGGEMADSFAHPLMTMFKLPCQIARLPRHHFLVRPGCSHSWWLQLAHDRGWAIHVFWYVFVPVEFSFCSAFWFLSPFFTIAFTVCLLLCPLFFCLFLNVCFHVFPVVAFFITFSLHVVSLRFTLFSHVSLFYRFPVEACNKKKSRRKTNDFGPTAGWGEATKKTNPRKTISVKQSRRP